MNLVVLQGRLTKEPIVRYTPDSQLAIASFSVAVDRGKKDGEDMGADFIPVKVFGKQAENCERFLGKGCRVSVQGKIQTGSYEDKNGQKVFTTDVIAQRVEFIDFKDKTPQNSNESETEGFAGFARVDDSEVPF